MRLLMNAPAPTRGAEETTNASWAGKPLVSGSIRALVVIAPVVASWGMSRLLSAFYWRPPGLAGLVVWLLQLVVVGSAVVMLTGRAMRRLLPLATLYSLSVAFPDQAPSRFRVALRSGNVRAMQEQFADVRAHGFADDRTTATTQILELIAALSKHEPRTRGHTDRVRAYTDVIAQEMGLNDAEREKLRWAAMMHDIGKLAVPAEILNKPGRPTEDEWQTLMTHPVIGGEMVEPLADWLGEWRHAASEHHERWDGNGYPRKLAGAQISLAGRIVAVADAYDVITSARSYKKPMSPEAARRELVRCAGTQFDPMVVRAFLNASIGTKRNSIGALGWLVEVPRAFVTVASQGAASAGAVAAAGSLAIASVAITPPPAPAAETVDAARAASHLDGPGMVVSVTAPKSQARASGAVADAGTASAAGAGASGATGPGTSTLVAGATVTTTMRTSTAVGPTTTTVATDAPSGATTPQTPGTTTTSSVAPATTTTAPTTACDALNAGATQLAGADLAGCKVTISSRKLVGVDLTGANLRGADLQGITLDGGTLYAADLTGATFVAATVQGMDLRNSLWSGANLRGATFDTDDLSNAVMTTVILNGSRWTGNTLARTDFTGATGKPPKSTGNTWSSTVCPDGTTSSTACF